MTPVQFSRLVVLGFVLLPAQSWAFKLSPCLRVLTMEDGQLGQEAIRWFNLCPFMPGKYKAAVHEHMTLATIDLYRKKQRADPLVDKASWRYTYMDSDELLWVGPTGKQHSSKGLMFGTWWNDDPLMLTWGKGNDIVSGAWDLLGFLRDETTYRTAGDCPYRVPKAGHLAHQSHLGRLQHLHFMTDKPAGENTRKTRITSTTEAALEWMEFAYKVATGKLTPDQTMFDAKGVPASLPAVGSNHCVNDQSVVKIKTLFTPRDESWEEVVPHSQGKTQRQALTPDIALGSMLHVMQDSFSPAHACRQLKMIDNRPYSVIVDIENYALQDHDSHEGLDEFPPWLQPRVRSPVAVTYQNDPVGVGKWLMEAVDREADWGKEVRPHLLSTIFQSDLESRPPFKCIGGRANPK